MCFTSIFIMDAMPTGWHEGWGWKGGSGVESWRGWRDWKHHVPCAKTTTLNKLWSTIHIDYLLYTDYT